MVITVNDWNDLDTVRNNLSEDIEFQSDLDSDTAGYDSLAGPDANGGSGWDPIGDLDNPHEENIVGNNHVVSDLYIDRPNLDLVGLFGVKIGSLGLTNSPRSVDNIGMSNCDVVGGGTQDEGGVGCFAGVSTLVDYSNCFVTDSTVSAEQNAGGWAGFANSLYAIDMWADVSVSAKTAGGMFGTIRNRSSSDRSGDAEDYSNIFSVGSVTEESGTDSSSGGIVAYIKEGTPSDILGSGRYWDTEASGQSDGVIGTGLTTSEMTGSSPTSTMSEFDFSDTWSTLTDDYPILQNFTEDEQSPPVIVEDWALGSDVIGDTVEEVRTWSSLELVIRYSGGASRSLVRQLKNNSEKLEVVSVSEGGFRTVDLADGSNTFTLNAPEDRSDVRPIKTWLVGAYDESALDREGNAYELELELVPVKEKVFDNEFGTFDSEPTPTRASNEWLFDFQYGAVATTNVSVGVDETGDGAEDIYTLETVMTPTETRVVEENLGYLNTVTLRDVPDGLDVLQDTSSDSRNTISVTVPDGVSDPLESGEYITESFETEWIGGAFRIELEVGQT